MLLKHFTRRQNAALSCRVCGIPALLYSRHLSRKTNEEKQKDEQMSQSHHWVETSDDGSNMRRIMFAQPKKPNAFHEELEKKREETFQWNHKFWKKHNTDFFKQKKNFSLKTSEKDMESKSENDISDEMSVFYKDFLDRNYELHMNYNRQWYKRNFGLLVLSLQASMKNIVDRFKH